LSQFHFSCRRVFAEFFPDVSYFYPANTQEKPHMSDVFHTTIPPVRAPRRPRGRALRKSITFAGEDYVPRDSVAAEAGVARETAQRKCKTGIIYVGGAAYGKHDQMLGDLLGLNQAPRPTRRSLKK
jgi:hypothetical protein